MAAVTGGIGVPPGEAFGGREEFRTTALEEDGEAWAETTPTAEEGPVEDGTAEELPGKADEADGAREETAPSEETADAAEDIPEEAEDAAPEL